MEYKLALIGFGNVGQGLTQILRDRAEDLRTAYGISFRIVAVCDLMKGSVCDPDGLDPAALLAAVADGGSLEQVQAKAKGWSPLRAIQESGADALVELSFTDLKTGEPAFTHMKTALERGMHAFTTNKGPVALHYAELARIAARTGAALGIEGTVMSGTPSLRLGGELLAGAGIRKIQGIVNGTTNYILSRMEEGATYEDALAQAQAQGYAEADPTGDVEGFDAAAKAAILANLFLGADLKPGDVDRTGITGLTPAEIAQAQAQGSRWKLVATVSREEGAARASVKPTLLPLAHPLSAVGGATNALTFTTDLLGDVTLVGPGAGRLETGYAILGDLLALHRKASTPAPALA